MTEDKLYTSDTKGTLGILAFSSITLLQLRRITDPPWGNSFSVQVDDDIVDLAYEIVASSTLHVDETGALAMDNDLYIEHPVPGYYYCIYHSDVLQCSAVIPLRHLVFYVDGLTSLRFQ